MSTRGLLRAWEQSTAIAGAEEPRPLPTVAEHQEQVARDFRHNGMAGILFEGTWALGMAFAIAGVFIPIYLAALSAPKALIGLVAQLGVLTVPLQLFSEHLIGGIHRRRNLWLLHSGIGFSYVFLGVVASLLPAEARNARIILFVGAMLIFFIFNALVAPVYTALITDNCPVRRRGRLYGYRAGALGTVGLLGLWPAQWVLNQFDGLARHHIAVIVAGAIFMLSSFCPLLFRDHIDPARLLRTKADSATQILRESLSLMRQLWHSPNYRVFIFFAVLLFASGSLATFVLTYGRDLLGTGQGLDQRYKMVFLIASVLNGLFIAAVADRWGYQLTLALQACIGLAAFALVQFYPSILIVMAAYGLLVIMTNGMGTAMSNLSVELMPQEAVGRLFAAGNMFCLPFTLTLPWLCGMALDSARQSQSAAATGWGYHLVFTLAAALALVAALGMALLVQEPRTGRVYEIKVLERV